MAIFDKLNIVKWSFKLHFFCLWNLKDKNTSLCYTNYRNSLKIELSKSFNCNFLAKILSKVKISCIIFPVFAKNLLLLKN